MQATLTIDDELMHAAQDLAAEKRTTVDDVVSAFVREGLRRTVSFETRNGIPLLPRRDNGTSVTTEMVQTLTNAVEEEDLQHALSAGR